MSVKDLSDDFIARAKECKSLEELRELTKDEGAELSDDELMVYAGGTDDTPWYEQDVFLECV
jgi:hypothetical protein